MAVNIYECGDLANVVISSNVKNAFVLFTSDGASGNVIINNKNPLVFLCSGQMSIDSTVGDINVFMSKISLVGVWTENFLMGLAGIICASLLSFVFVKYAV